MITCNVPTDLERFDNARQHRIRLKQRSRLSKTPHSETNLITYQKNTDTQNPMESSNMQKDLISYKLNSFLEKSQKANIWYSQAKLELMTLIKQTNCPDPECDEASCQFIEDKIEQQYSLWKSKVDTFFKTIHYEVKVSLDRLLSIAPLGYLKKNHPDKFVIYQRNYQLHSEFMQWVDYSQKIYKQHHQINHFINQVCELRLEMERLLRYGKIDADAYNTMNKRVTTVVMVEFKQITYPEPPCRQFDFNYRSYMHVSNHKLKLIELNQKLAPLVK